MPSHKKAFPLPTPVLEEDRTKTVYRSACRNGMRHAGNLYRDNPGTMPMYDETREWMENHYHRWDVFPGMIEWKASEALEHALDDAAEFVCNAFSVEFMEAASERGRNGYLLGISKARALKTGGIRVSPHIEFLRDHPELTALEASVQLDITKRQVNRIRSRMVVDDAERSRVEAIAELDEFFPETNVDISTEELDRMFPMRISLKPATTVRDKDQNPTPLPTQRDLSPSQPVRVHMPTPAPVTPSPDTIMETAKVALLVA